LEEAIEQVAGFGAQGFGLVVFFVADVAQIQAQD
jgi:hypothetical protein